MKIWGMIVGGVLTFALLVYLSFSMTSGIDPVAMETEDSSYTPTLEEPWSRVTSPLDFGQVLESENEDYDNLRSLIDSSVYPMFMDLNIPIEQDSLTLVGDPTFYRDYIIWNVENSVDGLTYLTIWTYDVYRVGVVFPDMESVPDSIDFDTFIPQVHQGLPAVTYVAVYQSRG